MTLEREFLLIVARPSRSVDDLERLRNLSRQELDWAKLHAAADFHLLLPALWRSMADLDQVPAIHRAEVKRAAIGGCARNLKLLSKTADLVESFEQAGVPLLVFKGPVLAQEAYGDLNQRWFSDVDIVVKRADAARATRILQSSGYEASFPIDGSWGRRYMDRFYELTFRGEHGTLVDLHWSLLDRRFSFAPREDEVWKHTRVVNVYEHQFTTMSPEMTAKYLCFHVAKHHWDRLGWLSDVAYWMTQRDDVAWDRLGRDPSAGRFILITLGLVERLLQCELPAEIRESIERDYIVKAQIDAIDGRLLRRPRQPVTTKAHWRTEFARAMPKARDRWESFCNTLFRPSIKEWTAFPLPRLLSPLYVLIRPCRLLWKQMKGHGEDPG